MSRSSRPLALLLALIPALLLPGILQAQRGGVHGTVTDTSGAPVSGVSITLEGTGLGTTTQAAGTYEFRNVADGIYTLRTRRVGYNPMSARVTLSGGAMVEQNFRLTPRPIQLAPIDVVVGSRAQHTAAEELALPVDVYTAGVIARQGTTETSQIRQALAPSVNFPRQTVTDATDIVRPFTLRGLSPDHSLVLVNGWRRHQMALVNTYAYGMAAGSSGVDLNALPASAIDRIEVLRDGASAQYGSDAIAGVINVVMKEGQFAPFLNADFGRYTTSDYADDGSAINLN